MDEDVCFTSLLSPFPSVNQSEMAQTFSADGVKSVDVQLSGENIDFL